MFVNQPSYRSKRLLAVLHSGSHALCEGESLSLRYSSCTTDLRSYFSFHEKSLGGLGDEAA
jgi:hypothetical protein